MENNSKNFYENHMDGLFYMQLCDESWVESCLSDVPTNYRYVAQNYLIGFSGSARPNWRSLDGCQNFLSNLDYLDFIGMDGMDHIKDAVSKYGRDIFNSKLKIPLIVSKGDESRAIPAPLITQEDLIDWAKEGASFSTIYSSILQFRFSGCFKPESGDSISDLKLKFLRSIGAGKGKSVLYALDDFIRFLWHNDSIDEDLQFKLIVQLVGDFYIEKFGYEWMVGEEYEGKMLTSQNRVWDVRGVVLNQIKNPKKSIIL